MKHVPISTVATFFINNNEKEVARTFLSYSPCLYGPLWRTNRSDNGSEVVQHEVKFIDKSLWSDRGSNLAGRSARHRLEADALTN